MPKKADAKLLAIAGVLRPRDKEGVAHSVVNRILDLILTGMLRAGDRLPSERELIDILAISRPSLREALRALAMLGVIESRHGGGAFVTNLEARTLLAPLDFFLSLSETNLADAFESRRIVELEIVRKAARKATRADIDDLNGMIAAHEKVLADPVGFRILDSRFHARLSEAAGNVVLERIAYGLYNMGLDVRRRATRTWRSSDRAPATMSASSRQSSPATPTGRPPRWRSTSTTSRKPRGRPCKPKSPRCRGSPAAEFHSGAFARDPIAHPTPPPRASARS